MHCSHTALWLVGRVCVWAQSPFEHNEFFQVCKKNATGYCWQREHYNYTYVKHSPMHPVYTYIHIVLCSVSVFVYVLVMQTVTCNCSQGSE